MALFLLLMCFSLFASGGLCFCDALRLSPAPLSRGLLVLFCPCLFNFVWCLFLFRFPLNSLPLPRSRLFFSSWHPLSRCVHSIPAKLKQFSHCDSGPLGLSLDTHIFLWVVLYLEKCLKALCECHVHEHRKTIAGFMRISFASCDDALFETIIMIVIIGNKA